MINLLLILVYIIAVYEGMRNGFLNQLISFLVIVIGFWISFILSPAITNTLEVWVPYPPPTSAEAFVLYPEEYAFMLDQSFYHILSFLLIFLLFWLLSKLVLYIIEPLSRFEGNVYVDLIGGAVLNLITVSIIVFLVLFMLSTMAAESIQGMIADNAWVRFIIEKTPFLSRLFYNEFIASLV